MNICTIKLSIIFLVFNVEKINDFKESILYNEVLLPKSLVIGNLQKSAKEIFKGNRVEDE